MLKKSLVANSFNSFAIAEALCAVLRQRSKRDLVSCEATIADARSDPLVGTRSVISHVITLREAARRYAGRKIALRINGLVMPARFTKKFSSTAASSFADWAPQ